MTAKERVLEIEPKARLEDRMVYSRHGASQRHRVVVDSAEHGWVIVFNLDHIRSWSVGEDSAWVASLHYLIARDWNGCDPGSIVVGTGQHPRDFASSLHR